MQKHSNENPGHDLYINTKTFMIICLKCEETSDATQEKSQGYLEDLRDIYRKFFAYQLMPHSDLDDEKIRNKNYQESLKRF